MPTEANTQVEIVHFTAVVRPNDGEVVLFGLDARSLPYNWDRKISKWVPYADEIAQYDEASA